MRRSLAKLVAFLCFVLCGFGCARDVELPPRNESLTIELRWIKGHPRERRTEIETGLLWSLSYLGAALPRDERYVLSWDDDIVTLRLDRAGVDESVAHHWMRLLDAMKASEEYRSNGAMDIGRFVVLTLCSARHYYALTGVSRRYEQARSGYLFAPQRIVIAESSIASGNRLIEVPSGIASDGMAFVAHEGTGSIRQGSFQIAEHEFLDVMSNGQLRFALYGLDGALKDAASESLTAAGKPTKCLWCHESQLMGPLVERTNPLEEHVAIGSEFLRNLRATRRSKIDFARTQDHTYAELLYVAFYQPSAERVAREWNMPVERVREALVGLRTHANEEFPFLGDELYERADVDTLAPYGVIAVPSDPREPSAYEPDLLN